MKKILLLVLVIILAAGGYYAYKESKKTTGTNTEVISMVNEYPGKFVYTLDTTKDQAPYKADCDARGGNFNACGTSCASDAAACIAVCAYTCTLGEEPQPAPAEQEATTTGDIAFNATLRLHVDQTKSTSTVKITPMELLEDSRCPVDVNCIQAGTVRIRVNLENEGAATSTVMALDEQKVIRGKIITFSNASPVKKSTQNIELKDYVFTFRIDQATSTSAKLPAKL